MIALKLGVRAVIRRGRSVLLLVLPAMLLFAMLTFVVATEKSAHDLAKPGPYQRSIRLGTVAGYPLGGFMFTRAEVNKLRTMPGVSVGAQASVNCWIDDNNKTEFNCSGADRVFLQVHDYSIHTTEADLDKWDAVKNGVILVRSVATKRGWKVGDHIKLHRPFGLLDVDLVVTSIQDQYTEDTIYYHSSYVDQLSNGGEDFFWSVWMLVDPPEHRQAVMDQVDSEMKALHRPHTIWKGEDTVGLVLSDSRTLNQTFEASGVMSFLLVLCLSVTLLIVSIEQRTTEFAAMVAIGFRRSVLARSILVEGVLLLLLSSALGAFTTCLLFHDHPIALSPVVSIKVPLNIALAITLGGTLLGLLSSIIPAWRLYRIDVLSSLR